MGLETSEAGANTLPRSLLDGVCEAVCTRLGIRRLDHVSALQELTKRADFPQGSVALAYGLIAENWR